MSLKKDLKERFLTFETFNGAVLFIPWGLGFIYCGLFALQFGYTYAMVSAGIVLTVWGLRKTFVNRIKQQVNVERLIKERKNVVDEGNQFYKSL